MTRGSATERYALNQAMGWTESGTAHSSMIRWYATEYDVEMERPEPTQDMVDPSISMLERTFIRYGERILKLQKEELDKYAKKCADTEENIRLQIETLYLHSITLENTLKRQDRVNKLIMMAMITLLIAII